MATWGHVTNFWPMIRRSVIWTFLDCDRKRSGPAFSSVPPLTAGAPAVILEHKMTLRLESIHKKGEIFFFFLYRVVWQRPWSCHISHRLCTSRLLLLLLKDLLYHWYFEFSIYIAKPYQGVGQFYQIKYMIEWLWCTLLKLKSTNPNNLFLQSQKMLRCVQFNSANI